MTTATIKTARDRFLDAIRSDFTESEDGRFYPAAPGESLVRIEVNDRTYVIERRRKAGSPWLPITTSRFGAFDAVSFSRWLVRWPLVL
jgi:hypothetical protein